MGSDNARRALENWGNHTVGHVNTEMSSHHFKGKGDRANADASRSRDRDRDRDP